MERWVERAEMMYWPILCRVEGYGAFPRPAMRMRGWEEEDVERVWLRAIGGKKRMCLRRSNSILRAFEVLLRVRGCHGTRTKAILR